MAGLEMPKEIMREGHVVAFWGVQPADLLRCNSGTGLDFSLSIVRIIRPLHNPLSIRGHGRHRWLAAQQSHMPVRIAGVGGGGLNVPAGDSQTGGVHFPWRTGQQAAHTAGCCRQLPPAAGGHIRSGTICDNRSRRTGPQCLINCPDAVRLVGGINKNAAFDQAVARQNGRQQLNGW